MFVTSLENEARVKADFFKDIGSSVSTMYVGGGTPSVLLPEQLARIVGCVKKVFDLNLQQMEFTVEVNPNDITPEYASFLVSLGVNRVSMGIQSFSDGHLKWMNRRHTAAEGEIAYTLLRNAGIENISIDLIFGYGMLGNREWEYNIEKAVVLCPEHISAYQMSIEPGSALGMLARRGKYEAPSQEVCEEQYRLLQKKLSEAGYVQYEISNFARRKSLSHTLPYAENLYISQHNSSYWNGIPYLGLGPAAHSFTGKSRFWNSESVKKYCTFYGSVNSALPLCDSAYAGVCGKEILTKEDIFNETVMLGLRQVCGFNLNKLDSSLLSCIEPEIDNFIKRRMLIKEGDNIRIPAERLFVSDSIIRELFV